MRTARFETPGVVHLHVDNPSGSVTIETRDQPVTEVELSIDRPGEEQELLDEIRLEAVPRNDGFDVFVEVPRRRRSGGGLSTLLRLLDMSHGVTVVVKAPRSASADVTTASAKVETEGEIAELSVKTASGSVDAKDVTGDLRVRTASGSVSARAVGGDATVETVSGKVGVTSVAGSASLRSTSGRVGVEHAEGELEVRTVSGTVEVGTAQTDTRVSSVSGSVRMDRCLQGEVALRTVSGSIVVGIAQGSALHVDAQAVSGNLESEIKLDEEHDGTHEVEHNVELEIRSVTGSVRVVRAGAAAA